MQVLEDLKSISLPTQSRRFGQDIFSRAFLSPKLSPLSLGIDLLLQNFVLYFLRTALNVSHVLRVLEQQPQQARYLIFRPYRLRNSTL
jgi:hypothetical protein